MASKLTPKQEAFIREYLRTGSGIEAYKRAYNAEGMVANSIYREACLLLQHPKVAQRLGVAQAKLEAKTEKVLDNLAVTKERIISELAKIGFSNMMDYIKPQDDGTAYIDLSKLSRDTAAAISEVTIDQYTEGEGDEARPVKKVKFKLLDKRAALVDLGKHMGMFVERREVGVPGDFDEKTDEQLAHEIATEAEDMGLVFHGSKSIN